MTLVNTEYTDKRTCAAFGEAGDDVEAPDFLRRQSGLFFLPEKGYPFTATALKKV